MVVQMFLTFRSRCQSSVGARGWREINCRLWYCNGADGGGLL